MKIFAQKWAFFLKKSQKSLKIAIFAYKWPIFAKIFWKSELTLPLLDPLGTPPLPPDRSPPPGGSDRANVWGGGGILPLIGKHPHMCSDPAHVCLPRPVKLKNSGKTRKLIEQNDYFEVKIDRKSLKNSVFTLKTTLFEKDFCRKVTTPLWHLGKAPPGLQLIQPWPRTRANERIVGGGRVKTNLYYSCVTPDQPQGSPPQTLPVTPKMHAFW